MRRIAIRTLGRFEVSVDGQPVAGFAYAKVRALLAYLAVEAPQAHTRAALAALLWPDQPEARARGSLSQALLTLRSALGDRQADEPLLLVDAQRVGLNPACALDLDAAQLGAAFAAAAAHAHHSWRSCASCAARLRDALALHRGDFLADVSVADSAGFEEWASLQHAQLTQLALSGLQRLAERAAWCGAGAEAIGYARRLVALDPWNEASQRLLIGLLAQNGEAAAAQAQFRQLQATLAAELGAAPEPASVALFEQIRRGEAVSPLPAAPPLAAPAPATPLVGRAAELAAACDLLRDGGAQLLTLTGPGGIGKTRLALEVARALRHDFDDGVRVVELAALQDAALVPAAIAASLGVKEQSQQPLAETLREALRPRQLLLVLDNFEHLAPAAPLVAELCAASPALRVLATSRAPLQIRAEQQLVLQPLDDAAALQLFLQRAAAAGAAPLAPDDADRYTAICRRLDRLPLAIELIAVRARAHTPHELLQLLDRSLLALADGPRDAAPRHQSLRHVIRWSYDLLADDEQRVFRALGAFVGGCTPEALQAVAGPEVDVGPAVEGLLRASLVQRQELAGQSRLLLLETIREFALEQLAQRDEAARARRRHAEQLAGFAMAAYQELLRPDAPRWVAWVAAEQANLRAAFRWARANGQHATALRLATGVWRFHYHYSQGSTRAGLEQLEEALADREQAPLELQCHALRAAGTLAGGLNDYARARRWLEDAVAVGWRLGDTRALQMALTNFGYALLEQGELEDARVHLEVSLSLAQRGAEPWAAKFPLGLLAGLHQRLGDLAQAQALSEEGLRLNRERQDPEGTADALRTLGRIQLARGELDRARQLGEQALAAHGAIGHHHGMGLDHALLGDAARARGDGPAALAHYRRCLALWWEREHLVATAAVLDSVAELLSRHDAAARAATLLGSAASLRARTEARLTPAEQAACDRTLAACRAALGEPACADAWATGRGLTLRQAMALALEPEPVAGTP